MFYFVFFLEVKKRYVFFFFFSSRRRHTRWTGDWSSDVCSSDLTFVKATQAYQQGQRTLPGRYYNAPEIWAEERERIFSRRWICVGRAAELAQPGDYAVRAVGGESVIVVRGQDGAVRAFYNVCRHRGTRLCETERGRLSETIQCPYHAWTYTLDGTLIGAPHMNEVAGFDKRD